MMSSHTRSYSCAVCSASFPSGPCRKGHTRREHGIPCDVPGCSRKLIGKDGLANHLDDKHTDDTEQLPCRCDQCNHVLTGQKGLIQHKEDKHGDGGKIHSLRTRDTQCQDCPAKFFDTKGLGQHHKQKHPAVLPKDSFLNNRTDNMNSYIAKNIQPNELFNTNMNVAVDKIATYLKGNPNLSVSKIVKSGSMGKGTAIRNTSDIDLVINVNGPKNMEEFNMNRGETLKSIRQYLDKWKDENIKITTDKCSYYVLKATAELPGYKEKISIDLLVGHDFSNPEDMYKEMTKDNAGEYSSSCALLQRDFAIDKPAHLKNLVRLVKHWNNGHLKDAKNEPNSYALELVIIDQWEKAGRPHTFKMPGAFKQIMRCLKNPTMINAAWSVNYNADIFKGQAPDDKDKPFLLDPANPFVNVASKFDWTEISKMAAASEDSPRLRDVDAGWT